MLRPFPCVTSLVLALSAIVTAASPATGYPADDGQELRCAVSTSCVATLPKLGKAEGFLNPATTFLTKTNKPRHRGRDIYVRQGTPVVINAKFAYGLADKDLEGEAIDVYLSPKCRDSWTKVSRVFTTADGSDPQGRADPGGRLLFALDTAITDTLTPGTYRILLVVAGDHTSTELTLDVLAPDAALIVADVDGTLTTKETTGVDAAIGLITPQANPGAAALLQAFATRGYHVLYLTARPEWLQAQTRAWLKGAGFPDGHVQTSVSVIGVTGAAAASYKRQSLLDLKAVADITPSFAFGNKVTDAKAYSDAGIAPERSYYFKMKGDPRGGEIFQDYNDLLSLATTAPSLCPI